MRRQITLEQRYQIAALLSNSVTLSRIAEILEFSVSTISREIKRNSKYSPIGDVYDPDFAEHLCSQRHRLKKKHIRFTEQMKRMVRWLIKRKWSPEQIVCTCRLRKIRMVSIESIYLYLYDLKASGINLCCQLRRSHRKRRKRSKNKHPRVLIKDRVSIHERTKAANQAKRPGYTEIDLMKCKNGYLVTITDKNSLYNIIRKIPSKHSDELINVIKEIAKTYAPIIKTITSDNGLEFVQHKKASEILGAKWYFADPYKSQQRGCNENQNGLIRQYFKRTTDLSLVTQKQILQVQKQLNFRPRKKINFKKPIDVFKNKFVAFIT